MAVFLSPIGNGQVFLTSAGLPAAFGFINTYQAGTSTPQATFTTQTGNIANAQPIPLTAAGMAPFEIWLTTGQAYKFIVTDAALNPIGPPFDNIYGIGDTSVGAIGINATEVSVFNYMTPAQITDAQSGTLSIDMSTAFQNAFNSGASTVFIPPFKYKLSAGIQFNGISVYSTGFQPTNPPSGCRLIFDLSVATCVTMGGPSATNQSASLRGLSILRAAGIPPAGSIGLLNQNTNATLIGDVASMSHQIPVEFKNNQNTLGLTCYIDHLYTGAAYDSHIVIDSWPETHFTNCRFGMAGSGDQNCNSYVRVQGGSILNAGDGPNTIRFSQCQFNQGVNTGTNWISFQNILGGSLIMPNVVQVSNCYVEDNVVGIVTDATVTALSYLQINNLVFLPPAATQQFWGLNAATKLADCVISNSNIQAAMTLTGATTAINFLSITGTNIAGACSFTGGNSSSVNLIGNFYKNGLTLAGAWGDLNAIGGNIVGGSLTNTATGSVKVDVSPNNAVAAFTPTLTFGGGNTGMTGTFHGAYQIFGNLVIGQFDVTLTAVGSSTGGAAVNLVGLPALSAILVANPDGGGMVNFASGMAALTAAPIMLSIGAGPLLNLFQQTATTVNAVTNGNFTATSAIRGTFQYFM